MDNSLLNKKWDKAYIKKESKYFLEMDENEYKTYPNLWDTIKVVLRGKSAPEGVLS